MTNILISKGDEAKKGEDARIELFFEGEKTAGKLLKNGSIDYKEIDLIRTVKKNQLLAVKHFAKDGIPGSDLNKGTTSAEKGMDIN
ncbi:flagellar assembly protein A, partial [candidate division KSB1 bacterium]